LKNSLLLIGLFFCACASTKNMRPAKLPHAVDNDLRTGEAFFKQAVSYNWRERDSLALEQPLKRLMEKKWTLLFMWPPIILWLVLIPIGRGFL